MTVSDKELEAYFDLVEVGLITDETTKEEADEMIESRIKGQ